MTRQSRFRKQQPHSPPQTNNNIQSTTPTTSEGKGGKAANLRLGMFRGFRLVFIMNGTFTYVLLVVVFWWFIRPFVFVLFSRVNIVTQSFL